jgi:hypothetical protein
MPLTREQFDKLDAQGFTPEEIASFEQRRQSEQSQPTQQPVEKQNILGQLFNVPAAANRSALQGTGYAQGAMQPSQVPTFEKLTKEAYPIRTDNIGTLSADLATRMPMQMAAQGVDIATDPAAMLGLLIGIKSPKPSIDKLAGKVVNSLIKPSHREFLFGKNPGMGVAKEGIIATNLESLATKVEQKITTLKEGVQVIRNTPENIYKTIDVSNVREPLVKALGKLSKTPLTNSQEISGIKDATTDITNLIGSMDKVGLQKLTISEGYQLKEAVSSMQKWNRESSLGTEVNKALKQVYHSIDSKIDEAVPELKSLNSRMADLISAKQAIIHRVEVLSKSEPMPTIGKLLDLPFAAFKTTGGKTLLGRVLAKQYKIPK